MQFSQGLFSRSCYFFSRTYHHDKYEIPLTYFDSHGSSSFSTNFLLKRYFYRRSDYFKNSISLPATQPFLCQLSNMFHEILICTRILNLRIVRKIHISHCFIILFDISRYMGSNRSAQQRFIKIYMNPSILLFKCSCSQGYIYPI